jgi:hypothetical protein
MRSLTQIQGTILLLLLGLTGLLSILMASFWHVIFIQSQFSQQQHQALQALIAAERDLNAIENALCDGTEHAIPQLHWVQFIPDTLHYAEQQGIDFYRVDISAHHPTWPIYSYIARRRGV